MNYHVARQPSCWALPDQFCRAHALWESQGAGLKPSKVQGGQGHVSAGLER